MIPEDKILRCADCGEEFVFTADEQSFYAEKGFRNEPKRCMKCRLAKRRNRGFSRDRGPRPQTEIICADCGKKAMVPFKPVQGKPVYCNECFAKRKASRM